MRVDELKKFARSVNIKTTAMLRAELEDALIEYPAHMLRSHALNSLSDRFKNSSNKFFESVSKSKVITDENISLLSRFHDQRKINASKKQSIKRAWERLNKKTKHEILLGLTKFTNQTK